MKTKLSISIDTYLGHPRKDRHFVKTQMFDNVLIPSTRAEYVSLSSLFRFFIQAVPSIKCEIQAIVGFKLWFNNHFLVYEQYSRVKHYLTLHKPVN